MDNKILVFSSEKEFEKFEKAIKRIAIRILDILGRKKTAVEIYLVGDRKMSALNKKYRDKDKTTNILSFEEPKEFIGPPLGRGLTRIERGTVRKIGEIYLNLNMAADCKPRIAAFKKGKNRKSEDRGLLTASELLVHGILHLLGYHHERESDRITMEKKEQLVLRKLEKYQ